MPKKGDIVINPKTSRGVKVGSRTWLTLVKDGILEGVYDDPNELYNLADNDTPEQIEQKRVELNNNLPAGKHAVKGRGKYKGKLVVRRAKVFAEQKPSGRELYASQQREDALENFSDAEIDAKLQELLSREMMRSCSVQSPRRVQSVRLGTSHATKQSNDEQYELFDGDDDGDDDDSLFFDEKNADEYAESLEDWYA
jgi:hypothetical protein